MALEDDLLAVLRDDGRLPISEVARRLRISRHQIDERLKHLVATDQLRFSANIHPAMLGINRYCHALLGATGSTADLTERLRHMPNVALVTATAGQYDVAIEIGARDEPHLVETLDEVRALPGVSAVRASIHTQSFVSRFAIDTHPGAPEFPPLDQTNKQLIDLLRADGRLPYHQLSSRVGLSIGAVRARVTRLIDSGLLRIVCIPKWVDARRNFIVGVGINVNGTSEARAEVVRILKASPHTEFGALSVGYFDLIATLSASSLLALRETLDLIRAQSGVARFESWMHLEVVRESYEEM